MIEIYAIDQSPAYLVAAALICLLSSWGAFRELSDIRQSGSARPLALLSVAISVGLGVWTTHFVAMLGYGPGLDLSFAYGETLASVVISAVVTTGCLMAAALTRSTVISILFAIGTAVSVMAMHQVGMTGLRGAALAFALPTVIFFAGVAAAFAIGAVAAIRSRSRYGVLIGAGFFVATVLAVHFGALSGTSICSVETGSTEGISAGALGVLQFAAALVLCAPAATYLRRKLRSALDAQRSARVAYATGDGVAIMDGRGRISWVNEAYQRLSERPAAAFVGRSMVEVFRETAPEAEVAKIAAAIEAGRAATIRIQGSAGDRQRRWEEIRIVPIRDGEGRLQQIVSCHRDVTKEEETARRLRDTEALTRRLALVAEHSSDAILICDRQGRTLWVNSSFETLTQYALADMVGRRPGDLLQGPETSEETRRRMSEGIAAGDPVKVEVLNYRRDQSAYWIELGITPISDPHMPDIGFIAVSRNVTERIERERALIEARRRAEAADRLKSEFLARMSHEIRTPMNGVTGMAELLTTTALDETQAEFVDVIKASSGRLLRVVNDVIDVSKIGSGQLELRNAPFDPAALAAATLRPFKTEAAKKGIRVDLEVAGDLPDGVVGDADRIRQVLENLLDNAVRFTDAGEMTLKVEAMAGERPGEALVAFEASDTGVGIEADFMPFVFDAFSQADGSERREREGVGLGLSIAKGLVDAMRGRISVTSTRGAGTNARVEINLPVAQRAAAPTERMAPASSHERSDVGPCEVSGGVAFADGA